MRSRGRFLALTALLGLVVPMSGAGAATAVQNSSAVAESGDAHDDPGLQHGGPGGHLPGSSDNVDLVGQVTVSGATGVDKPGHIADVAVGGNFAYLAARRVNTAPCGVGGFYVIDISDPTVPTEVGFTAFPPGTYPGEGMQVLGLNTPAFKGDVLVTNNENCSLVGSIGGFSLYDITDPLNPAALSLGNGDKDGGASVATTMHSAFGWQAGKRAFAIGVDNGEFGVDDTEIWEITDPTNPIRLAEVGLVDWPGAEVLGNGDTVFLHDLVVKKVRGHYLALLSYWDAGWIILNVDDPANPVFLNDSNHPDPEPLLGFSPPEGNSHQAEWSHNNKFIIGTDEDFSPTRVSCTIDTGPNAGGTGCGQFGWTVPLETNFPGGLTGTTVFGGSGCVEDVNGNGTSDRDEVPSQAVTGADIIVFGRGTCFFSIKVESGELAGYDAVIVGNSHAGSAFGLTPNAFICGGQGSPVLGIASGICVGHKAMHDLFNDAPAFTGPDLETGGDLPAIGTLGETLSATAGVFDGWGTVHLLNASNLEEVDNYAVPEGIDPAFATGFGTMSVHEVAMDKAEDLAYLSYYDAGLRVVRFGSAGIEEVGHYVDVNGNDFWGVEAHRLPGSEETLILGSDRDSGLWIFRYTGD